MGSLVSPAKFFGASRSQPLNELRSRLAVDPKMTSEITVKQSDMPLELQKTAVEVVREAFESSETEKDTATKIKQVFEKKFPKSAWHVIVGKHFGVSITHATTNLIFLSVNQHSVLLFRSDDE